MAAAAASASGSGSDERILSLFSTASDKPIDLDAVKLEAARDLLSSDNGKGDSLATSSAGTHSADTITETAEPSSNKVEINSRPPETAPSLSAAAQEAATSLAPLGIASLIALPAGVTTPARDTTFLYQRHAAQSSVVRRPVKGASMLGQDEVFKRSTIENTPPGFADSTPEGQPPNKKAKREDFGKILDPVVQMAVELKEVMDNADTVAAAKATLKADAAISSQVAAEQ